MSMDLQHWALLLGTPVATAFVDYLVNSRSLDKNTLVHAGLSALLVGLAVMKDVVAKQVPPPAK